MATYKTMDASYLGDNATDADLALFRRVCARKQELTGWNDEQVTEWMWNDGDWATTVADML